MAKIARNAVDTSDDQDPKGNLNVWKEHNNNPGPVKCAYVAC